MSDLPAGCARSLGIALLGCMNTIGSDAMFLDQEHSFAPDMLKIARVSRHCRELPDLATR